MRAGRRHEHDVARGGQVVAIEVVVDDVGGEPDALRDELELDGAGVADVIEADAAPGGQRRRGGCRRRRRAAGDTAGACASRRRRQRLRARGRRRQRRAGSAPQGEHGAGDGARRAGMSRRIAPAAPAAPATAQRPIRAAIRCSVGGCVLNSESRPPTVNGLMMNMCAVAGLASSGSALRAHLQLAQRVDQAVRAAGDLGAAGVGGELARARDGRLDQRRRNRREDASSRAARSGCCRRLRDRPSGRRRRTSRRTAPCARRT